MYRIVFAKEYLLTLGLINENHPNMRLLMMCSASTKISIVHFIDPSTPLSESTVRIRCQFESDPVIPVFK